ncbi:hypothetical protein GCM10022267_89290 [Lentzea roselyniae]|uniref:Transposase n=1 Tax=Lentzea roselyniae TaxID=531940 RepID=A0ABP7CH98_9PSEU
MKRDIRERIKQWNAEPEPYVWTCTANQILESLARFAGEFRRRTLMRPRLGPPSGVAGLVRSLWLSACLVA